MRAQSSAPNVVFLLTDDQRWDTLGCMGNPIIRTPNIDGLSRQGVTFENHFVTTSICMTSRASIFTGLYARSHGVTDFARSFSEDQFARTYPALLRAAGYHTGFIGKYGVGNKMPVEKFDFWRGFPGQGKYFPDGEPGPHLTERMGDQALAFLDGAPRGKPFSLSISFKAAHVQDEDPRQFLPSPASDALYRDTRFPAPATADPRFVDQLPVEVHRSENRRRWAVRFGTPELFQTSVRNYYRLISEVDTVVGRIREQLRRIGAEDNTVIAFSGDNGFYLGEHGLAGKWLMHEESIRVPMILYDPRLPAGLRGARRQAMTLNIDIAPTLLEAAGIAAPAGMQGRSLYAPARSAAAP
ncbi:MAG: sulfatase-like hydrolase/transferase [Bryobacteraceae bacterium]